MTDQAEASMDHGSIDRRKALPALFPNHRDYLFVSGLAGSARDIASLTDDGDHLFSLGGVMGAASMIGLGVAMGAPERQVAVVTGDGELLMNIGCLVTIASAAAKNLSIVCIDNGRHGETGNQPGHTSRHTSLEDIALGAGFGNVLTVSNEDELPSAAEFLKNGEGPRLLVVCVLPTGPSAYKRLMDPPACRVRFRNAYAARYLS